VGAVLVCGLLGYAFGFRTLKLLLFVVVLWFPVTAFLFAVLNFTFNPKVEEGYPDSSDLNLRG
jgi:hypothetical protein